MPDDPHALAKQMLEEIMTTPPEPERVGITPSALAWHRFLRERAAFHMWLSQVDPSLPAVFHATSSEPTTLAEINALTAQMHVDLYSTLDALFAGNRFAAWEACGRPAALRYFAGLDREPLSPREWDLETWFDSGEGKRPGNKSADGRSRAVVEPATGQVWSTVGDAAAAADTSRVYMSQHLNNRVPHIKGRKFRYAE